MNIQGKQTEIVSLKNELTQVKKDKEDLQNQIEKIKKDEANEINKNREINSLKGEISSLTKKMSKRRSF